jgi:methionine-gamma-lyase
MPLLKNERKSKLLFMESLQRIASLFQSSQLKSKIMENFNAANAIQDLQYFGEFGGKPFNFRQFYLHFLSAKTMFDTFEGNAEGCYLYSRHSSPMNSIFGTSFAKMEGTETANVTASGMGAITSTLLQICKSGDHIVSARTIYGGTYAFMKNFLPPFKLRRVL